jgi:hypothetical protein
MQERNINTRVLKSCKSSLYSNNKSKGFKIFVFGTLKPRYCPGMKNDRVIDPNGCSSLVPAAPRAARPEFPGSHLLGKQA